MYSCSRPRAHAYGATAVTTGPPLTQGALSTQTSAFLQQWHAHSPCSSAHTPGPPHFAASILQLYVDGCAELARTRVRAWQSPPAPTPAYTVPQ